MKRADGGLGRKNLAGVLSGQMAVGGVCKITVPTGKLPWGLGPDWS